MTNDMHALAGAYVLDALDDDEREAFEAVMATSPDLVAEVESLREVAGLLGSAAVETPPAGMKAAVMGRIDTVRQERPVVDAPVVDSPPADELGRRRAARQRTSPGWAMRLTTVAAAVATLVAVGLGVVVAQLSSRIDEVEASGQQVAAVVAAEDAHRVTADLPDGGHLSAVVSAEQGAAVVVGDQLTALEADRMYALWAIEEGQPLPVGELVAGDVVTVSGRPLDAIGLTVEPRGELTQPTGEVIALLEA